MTWVFTDDRGVTVRTDEVPERLAAYTRAGAALWDLGVRSVGSYGSAADGGLPDPAKAGALTAARVPYLGAGEALDRDALHAVKPDLLVDVTYDREHAHAVGESRAARTGIPLVALAVGGDAPLARILDRFAELARSLGAEPGDGAGARGELGAAEEAVRAAVGDHSALRVLALSATLTGEVRLARPGAWPELARLRELGVPLAEPGPHDGARRDRTGADRVGRTGPDGTGVARAGPGGAGPGGAGPDGTGPVGAWSDGTWADVVDLDPDLVLLDARAAALKPAALAAVPAWRTLSATAVVSPWNPELPLSEAACAAFLREVAAASGALRGRGARP